MIKPTPTQIDIAVALLTASAQDARIDMRGMEDEEASLYLENVEAWEAVAKFLSGQPSVVHIGVHTSHCCAVHGCKYGNSKCPVVLGTHKQQYPCEDCG